MQQLPFAIAIALRDHVLHPLEFLPRRKDQIQYDCQSLLEFRRILTKDEPHALYGAWPCGSRCSGGLAVRVLRLSFSNSGGYPSLPEAAAMTVDSPETTLALDNRTPDVHMLVLPLLWGRIGEMPAHSQ
jgi:hypothetical protein